jgi:hypothetical protein
MQSSSRHHLPFSSEGLTLFNLSAELLTSRLQVGNSPFGGVPDELVTPHPQQLRCFSTRDVALAIEFQDNQLMGGFLDRAMQLFEHSDQILIEWDLNRSHGVTLNAYITPEPAWTDSRF